MRLFSTSLLSVMADSYRMKKCDGPVAHHTHRASSACQAGARKKSMASVANAAASISKPNVIACSLVGITLSLSHEWLMQTDIELSSTADKMSELDYLLATLKV